MGSWNWNQIFSDSRLTVYYTRYRYYYRLVRLKSSLETNRLISEWCFNAALWLAVTIVGGSIAPYGAHLFTNKSLIFISDEEIKKAENIEINAENYIAAQNELHNLNLKCAKLEAEKREIKWKVSSKSYFITAFRRGWQLIPLCNGPGWRGARREALLDKINEKSSRFLKTNVLSGEKR